MQAIPSRGARRARTAARAIPGGVCRDTNGNRRARENVHPPLEARGSTATEAEGQAEGRNAAFASVFHSPASSAPGAQPPELEGRDGERNKPPVIPEGAADDLLRRLDTRKATGPAGIPPRAPRELAEELAKPPSITAQQPWLTGEVPGGWRLAPGPPGDRRGRQEDPGSHGPVSLTWAAGKVMEPSSRVRSAGRGRTARGWGPASTAP